MNAPNSYDFVEEKKTIQLTSILDKPNHLFAEYANFSSKIKSNRIRALINITDDDDRYLILSEILYQVRVYFIFIHA